MRSAYGTQARPNIRLSAGRRRRRRPGLCVEELTLEDIHEKYGPDGIQGYDTVNGFATVSSHTQLAMFTANGLLFGATRGATRG